MKTLAELASLIEATFKKRKDKIKALEGGKKQDKEYADHLEDKVELLEKENKKLKEKMAVSSIGFDLPKDYYESDKYRVWERG
ncbi:MAG TPA: hypothetical protein ENH85_14400 [Candidatus Scalindua sp.]|nr:hypothetical protein [Candidatus Scalindua sp.]